MEEANTQIGSIMIFQMVEKLRSVLIDFNQRVVDGLFALLAHDNFYEILGNLSPRDLCALSSTNKFMKKHAESEVLWNRICAGDYDVSRFKSMNSDSIDFSTMHPKQIWVRVHQLVRPEKMAFISSFVLRVGTGEDDWSLDYLGVSWRSRLLYHLNFGNETKRTLLDDESKKKPISHEILFLPSGQIESGKQVIGHYRLLSKEQAIRKYKQQISDSIERYEKEQQQEDACPYVGKTLGFLEWSGRSADLPYISTHCMSITRGFLLGLHANSYINCLSFNQITLRDLIFMQSPSVSGLLVNSNTFFQRPPYVNELTKTINRKLQKSDSPNTYVQIHAEKYFIYSSVKGPSPETLSLKIRIWTFNEDGYLHLQTAEEPARRRVSDNLFGGEYYQAKGYESEKFKGWFQNLQVEVFPQEKQIEFSTVLSPFKRDDPKTNEVVIPSTKSPLKT